jgi:hypothetical protein
LVELRAGCKLVCNKLPGPVIGLLRQGQVGGGAVDLGFALGDDLGTRTDIDARQLGIGDQLFRLGLVQLGDQLRVVDHQEGRDRGNVLAASYRNLHEATRDSGRNVDAGAFYLSLFEQWFGPCQIPDCQPDNGEKDGHGDDGAGIEPRPRPSRGGARPGHGPGERGGRCGGRRRFGHRFQAATVGT